MKLRLACLAVLASLAAASPALAQADDMSPARLKNIDARAAEMQLSVDHMRAMAIAKENGMATVRELKLSKIGKWKVEGVDAKGQKLGVRIDGNSGQVEKVDRD